MACRFHKDSSATRVGFAFRRTAAEGVHLWGALPEEVLRVILERLEGDQRALVALRCSSKQLKRVVGQHVEMLSGRFSDLGLQNCSKACPQLRQLTIRPFSPLTDLSPLAPLTQLSKLSCAFTKTLSDTRSVRCLPDSITELDIRGSCIGGRGLLALNLPLLRVLDIRDVALLAKQDVLGLLTGCKDLEVGSFSRSAPAWMPERKTGRPHFACLPQSVTAGTGHHLLHSRKARSSPSHPSQVLGISGEHKLMECFWPRLKQFPRLRELRISQAWLSCAVEEGEVPVQLERLDIAFSTVSSAALQSLLRGLKRLKLLSLDVVAADGDWDWDRDWSCRHTALQDLQLFVPLLKLDGLRLPALRRLWLMPLLGPDAQFLPSMCTMRNLTSLLLANVRRVRESDLLLGQALAGLPLRELAVVRCGRELEMSVLANLGQCPSLEALTVIQLCLDEAWPPACKTTAEAAICEAPSLRLLMGEGMVVEFAAQSAAWKKVPCSEVLDARLKYFARHGGMWFCFSRRPRGASTNVTS